MCGTLELFYGHPDVGKGGPAPREKGKVAKVLAEDAGGPAHSPETRASLPAVLGTRSAIRTLKCSQRGHPPSLPHNNHYLLWMLAVPTIHTEDLSPEASHTHWNMNQLPKHRPLLQRRGTETVKGRTTSSSGGNPSGSMYLEKVNSLKMLGGLPYYLQKFW